VKGGGRRGARTELRERLVAWLGASSCPWPRPSCRWS